MKWRPSNQQKATDPDRLLVKKKDESIDVTRHEIQRHGQAWQAICITLAICQMSFLIIGKPPTYLRSDKDFQDKEYNIY